MKESDNIDCHQEGELVPLYPGNKGKESSLYIIW